MINSHLASYLIANIHKITIIFYTQLFRENKNYEENRS